MRWLLERDRHTPSEETDDHGSEIYLIPKREQCKCYVVNYYHINICRDLENSDIGSWL